MIPAEMRGPCRYRDERESSRALEQTDNDAWIRCSSPPGTRIVSLRRRGPCPAAFAFGQNVNLIEATPRRAASAAPPVWVPAVVEAVAGIVPKAALVLAPPPKGSVNEVFGFPGLKWLKALNAWKRISRILFSPQTWNCLYTVRSMFSMPGPYVRVGGALPMPSEFTGGSEKLAALKGYKSFELELSAEYRGPVSWQRNGNPPVGVPVQYPIGAG